MDCAKGRGTLIEFQDNLELTAERLASLEPDRVLLETIHSAKGMERRSVFVINVHDESLPYSDHADFNDLLSYVEAVKPQRVFTVFGFDQLASHLQQLGYNASHLQCKAASQQLRLL